MMRTNLPIVLAVCLVILRSNVAGLERENLQGNPLSRKGEIKYQVSLQTSNNVHFCGGTLIAPDVVLTAAHCFYDKKTNSYTATSTINVVAGTTHVKDYTYNTIVKKIYIHKEYVSNENSNERFVNDIALLRLENGFYVGENSPIKLARLPRADQDFMGIIATVSGFGWDYAEKTGIMDHIGYSTGQLRRASVKIMNWHDCLPEGHPTLICGKVEQHPGIRSGVCPGDSGGPLMFGNIVIGIVSYGVIGCDESEYSSGYTNVSKFFDFIYHVLNNEETDNMIVLNHQDNDHLHGPDRFFFNR